MKNAFTFTVPLLIFLASTSTLAAFKLAPAFGDHMVLQRGMTVPVWGQAAAGEQVTVVFRKQSKSTKADANGRWRVELDALKGGGPDELKITASKTIVLKDVLVGEVWVGSGQSNMAGNVGGYAKRDTNLNKLLESAPYEDIRLKKNPGAWSPATDKSVAGHSALLFAFGHRLHKELNVPVGLIVGAVGGTPSGMWTPRTYFENDESCKKVIAEYAAKRDMKAENARYERSLIKWAKTVEAFKKQGKKKLPRKPQPPKAPGESSRGGKIGGLYERYIQSVAGFAVRGVLWDQGESGTGIVGLDQYTMMGSLINGWRADWKQDLPFIYIQKPSGGGCAWDPSNPITANAEKLAKLPASANDGAYRELHIRIQDYPKTWMSCATDLGSGIHPTNKWGYGQRAARVALGAVYGKDVAISGPTYESHKVEGGTIRVKFNHVGKGLAFKHGDTLQGFAIAGDDKQFHWASAVIDGDTVVLSSDKVRTPTAVRYAWSRKSAWANLFNADGLPALTFRTDNW